ncbi:MULTISPECIES: initiation control protein YabA [Lactobacillaceae]|uniref:initiation control protein YabA n=1 Tax=Lactobacillaceae TaxID=33958 RepID=UPI000C1B67F5|nr:MULTISPECIES: initiation control protein YabA [Lactobacillaceae]
MAQNDLYDEFETISNELDDLTKRIASLKERLSIDLEEKEELKLENKNLRSHLINSGLDEKKVDKKTLSTSRKNLEKLYQQGFHVCQQFYGSHRDQSEECVFCYGVIYGGQPKNINE